MFPGLRVHCYRLSLRALDRVELPPFSGSSLRGALAGTFRHLTCQQPHREACAGCVLLRVCAYPAVFEPQAPPDAARAGGFEQFPRPFVVVPPDHSQLSYPPESLLQAGLVLLGTGNDFLPYFLLALRDLAQAGIGRGRGAVRLERVEALHPLTGQRAGVWDGGDSPVRSASLAVTWPEIEAHAAALPADRVGVRFLTPTCLKVRGLVALEPSFADLARCLLRRFSRLAQAYAGDTPDIRYADLLARAQAVRTESISLESHCWERYSRRQDRRLPARGILGRVQYAGPVAEFLPLLILGSLAHVGDNAALGQGRYELVNG